MLIDIGQQQQRRANRNLPIDFVKHRRSHLYPRCPPNSDFILLPPSASYHVLSATTTAVHDHPPRDQPQVTPIILQLATRFDQYRSSEQCRSTSEDTWVDILLQNLRSDDAPKRGPVQGQAYDRLQKARTRVAAAMSILPARMVRANMG
ncbi:hypothetical protein PM082_010985 [Marasmius tenuissimus]|nr:hypothetical protein PM082_010985 [Marasmius tenuissimus]